MAACPFNDRIVVLVDPDLASAVPVILPDNTFQKRAATACHTAAYLTGPPPVLRTGPHAVGDADTDALKECRMIVLPTKWSQQAVEQAPAACYSLNRFYAMLLGPGLASADADKRATLIASWWRLACTNSAGAISMSSCLPITSAMPNYVLALNQHVASVKNGILARVGLGGPELTTAAFNAGITDLRATFDHNAAEQLPRISSKSTG